MTILPKPYKRLNRKTGKYETVQPKPIDLAKKGRKYLGHGLTVGKARKR